jgi:hypothetical protein
MKRRQRKTVGVVCATMLAALLATFAFGGSASAFSELYKKFQFCPIKTAGVTRCMHSVTESGSVTLGSKKVPIVNPVTLQGGFGLPTEGFSPLVAATNGVTLSKTPQPVPGGLAGLVKCNEISNFFLRISCEAVFENGVTGVNSTLELAGQVNISEVNLREKEGIALKMPIKVKLENPFLGSNCYVGSDKAPIIWNLTAGTTTPPAGTEPITGETGTIELLDGGRILKLTKNSLVENNWAAPKASGCGGLFSFLIDPIVNASSGLPSAAGKNVAILNNTIHLASRNAVNKDNELNP